MIYQISQVPSCSRLAPLPAPVRYVVGHRVRVRERCSQLSCIQSRLPTGYLDVFPDRGRPSRTSDRGRGTELVRQAVEQRTTRLMIESFRSQPPAPQRRRRSRYKSRLQPSPIYTCVCLWSCAHRLACT